VVFDRELRLDVPSSEPLAKPARFFTEPRPSRCGDTRSSAPPAACACAASGQAAAAPRGGWIASRRRIETPQPARNDTCPRVLQV